MTEFISRSFGQKEFEVIIKTDNKKHYKVAEDFARKLIDHSKPPAVDAVPVVHGRWLFKWDAEKDPKRLFVRIVCSECNLHTGQKSNYCPNCGAKMDGGLFYE